MPPSRQIATPLLVLLAFCCRWAAAEVDYASVIKPLLAEKCTSCHGAIRQEAGLRLDHGGLIRRGSDEGQVIDFARINDSPLLRRVTTTDLDFRMPPEDEGEPLTVEQVRLLSTWIAGGARSPADEIVPAGPEQHWAWQVLRAPPVPVTGDRAWSLNAIDAFVFAQLQERGIEPLPVADKGARLRRLYFDLIGLPPTPREQLEFLNDASPDAWSAVVNRLLDDPAHGERWARHWMDVWRYSDWDGFKNELRGSQRHIWRWRDWIIEALNSDKGYDQMIVEMLAGDEVAPTNENVLRATGFLARNYHNSNRNIWLDATVEHTAKAFLAMTINCARCHDHKYDPLSQREYYAFRAIFEPHHVRTERLPGEPDLERLGLARVFDAKPDEPTYLLVGGNEKHPDTEHPLEPGVPAAFQAALEIVPVQLPAEAVFPALRPFVEQEDVSAAERRLAEASEKLLLIETSSNAEATGESSDQDYAAELARQTVSVAKSELVALKARWTADKARYARAAQLDWSETQRTAVMAEHRAQVERAKLTLLEKTKAFQAAEHGDSDGPLEAKASEKARQEVEAAKKALDEVIAGPESNAEYTPVAEAFPVRSTGRRLALARWITRPDNPLTARVAANYVWMQHFGEPLVANVFDFGMRSPEPPYRQLLDWLAMELIQHDWSLKHLHRLITNSRTYQLASSVADRTHYELGDRLDPQNRLFWRANVRRLEAEVIRDSLLFVAGSLDRSRGGPAIEFGLGETVPRRSVYFQHAYEKQMTMLVLFDAAAPTECYRRSTSIIPQQALALANSPLSFDQARLLTAKLAYSSEHVPDDTDFITSAFRTLLCRDCTTDELQACGEFLAAQTLLLAESGLTPLPGTAGGVTKPSKDAGRRARESFIHTLMNHNDFVTIR